MHQKISIKYDEISPFTVNIILCHHYCSIVAVKEFCREWHGGVVQYACSVSVSESLPLPLPHAPANKYYVIVLCWYQYHAVCFVLSLVLISVQRTIFTRLQKPGFMLIVKITPHSNQSFLATDDRVNCICFLDQDTMLIVTPTSLCLGKHGWLVTQLRDDCLSYVRSHAGCDASYYIVTSRQGSVFEVNTGLVEDGYRSLPVIGASIMHGST